MTTRLARFSVKFVAVCVRVLGTICAIYALGGFWFVGISQVSKGWPNLALGLAALLIMGGPAILCFTAAKALSKGLRWAWISSQVICLIIMVLSAAFFSFAFSVADAQEAGKGFGIGAGATLLLPSLMGLILLNLPATRAYVNTPR